MKHEWRKKEKAIYFPKNSPEVITIPTHKFLSVKGEGNPNSASFAQCIGALYSVAYAIKMTAKKLDPAPNDYIDYTVYPLEGIRDINEEAKKTFDGTINKDDFIFNLMIRQPHFIHETFFEEMLALTKIKKPNDLLSTVKFEEITDGKCIQMMHHGSYDNEPETFKQMEKFAEQEGLKRKSKIHREIYLTDFRKVPEEKLKTVLRFQLS